MREKGYKIDDLCWMMPAEDMRNFLKELIEKTLAD
jgi:hypothetical protein